MTKTIVQILGNTKYNEVEFIVNNQRRERAKLSSIALYNVFKENEKVKVIYYIPESVITNLDYSLEKALESIRYPYEYTKDYINKLGLNIGKDFEVRPISSIGLYNNSNKDYEIIFENYIENIIIELTSDLLFIEDELILDISTGLNYYIRALNDTAKNLLVYDRLKGILQGNKRLKIKTAIIPPVFGQSNAPIPINFLEDNAKAFFEFPYKSMNINYNFIKVLDNRENIGDIYKRAPRIKPLTKSRIILTAYLALNCIKNNIPLAFFTKELLSFSNSEEIIEKQLEKIRSLPKFIKDNVIQNRTEDKVIIKTLKVIKDNIINCLFSLAFFESFKTFYNDCILDSKPYLDKIEEIFSKLYSKLGLDLNKRFIQRDIGEIKEKLSKLSLKEEKRLKELMYHKSKENSVKEGMRGIDKKRNFFAHSGFLNDVILVRKEANKILIRYDDIFINEILQWLKNPN
ncbi:MAG: TM1812 family CRISPR-associated protein [Promethearchaeota archaeon]